MSTGDLSFAFASLLLERFVAAGMRAVVVSPGSRSTPLALAAARAREITVHVMLDERAAGFFALGISKAAGAPVGLVCTSGTAAANHLPAVVEASMTRVPLLVMTADRPPSLRGTGANQTIDQTHLFGAYPRAFLEMPLPAPGTARAWHDAATAAIEAALGSPPGPVHLNVPFDEPLVPTGEQVALGDTEHAPPSVVRDEGPDEQDVVFVRELLDREEQGVVVAGTLDEAAPSVVDLARDAGWPLLAEPASNLRVPGALSAGAFVMNPFEPDVVLQVGRAPVARTTQSLVARARTLVVVQTPGVPADPGSRAARTITSDPEVLARAARSGSRAPRAWLQRWLTADRAARATLDDLLDKIDEPFEPRIARDVAAALPDGATLFVGNSMPVRDLDATMAPRAGITVRANRGASGIDGTVSTALGIAAVAGPVVALIGDLALLHDASGLLWAGRTARDVVFVVPNNSGGGIFDLLAQSGLPERDELFVTPHRVDIAALARAAGVRHETVREGADVARVLGDALARGGCTIVEVSVDRERSQTLRALLRERLQAQA